MLNQLQKLFYPRHIARVSEGNDEVYLYMKLWTAALVAGAAHLIIILILLLSRDHIPFLYGLNCVSLLVYAISLFCIRKRLYALSGALIAAEIIFYTLACIVVTGMDTYVVFYLFVVLIMQLVIPYASPSRRAVVTGFVWAAVMSAVLIGYFKTPVIALGPSRLAMCVFNVNLGFWGVLVELYVDSILQKIVHGYNDKKLSELREQTFTDPLTGLYNRRYAAQRFEALRMARLPVKQCVAILDIDDFKKINDTYGHSIGDEVLAWLGRFLTSTLRYSDVVIRWGGEEFLLVLDEVDEKTAFTVLDNLRKKISGSVVTIGGIQVKLKVTIGAAALDVFNIDKSIENSDRRLYLGKSTGKNQVVVSS